MHKTTSAENKFSKTKNLLISIRFYTHISSQLLCSVTSIIGFFFLNFFSASVASSGGFSDISGK